MTYMIYPTFVMFLQIPNRVYVTGDGDGVTATCDGDVCLRRAPLAQGNLSNSLTWIARSASAAQRRLRASPLPPARKPAETLL